MATTFPRDWVPPVAGRQSGLFTAEQACDAGMTRRQVRRRLDTDRWRYVVGDAIAPDAHPLDAWTRAQGAALTWPDSVVCLASAAALHRFPVPDPAAVHVSVIGHQRHRLNLIPHELRLEPGDYGRAGIALVTTRRRTLFDCLGRLAAREREELLIWAITREILTVDELEQAVAARPKAWGNAHRRRAAADSKNGAMGSAERRMHALLRAAGVTGWRGDQRVWDSEGLIGRVDVLFEGERLVIEIDGLAYHGEDRFQADRTRQNRLVNAGYTVLRFTWADLHDRPEEVIRQIRVALARAHARSGRM